MQSHVNDKERVQIALASLLPKDEHFLDYLAVTTPLERPPMSDQALIDQYNHLLVRLAIK